MAKTENPETSLIKYTRSESCLGDRPPPPPLPEYDPKEEPPMWNSDRAKYNLPVDKGPKSWPSIGEQPASSSDPDWRGVIKDKVIELPLPEPYKEFANAQSPKYYWFDTPDYADPFKKLWWSTKFFFLSGGIIASVRGQMTGRDPTLKNNFWLLRKVFSPWFFSGLAASVTVIAVANLRGKKDDLYNYLAAGIVMGGCLGRKNWLTWVRYTVPAIPIALLVKYGNENNTSFLSRPSPYSRNYFISGGDAKGGIGSGDFTFGYRRPYGDPGRDVRTPY